MDAFLSTTQAVLVNLNIVPFFARYGLCAATSYMWFAKFIKKI